MMMSTNNNADSSLGSIIDPTTGRCTLHPSIQLLNKAKNGEWRRSALLKACPLCVSGLPPTTAAAFSSSGAMQRSPENDYMQYQLQQETVAAPQHVHQQSQQLLQRQAVAQHHNASPPSPPSQDVKRPDPEDYREFQKNRSQSSISATLARPTAAERLVRHYQMSPSPALPHHRPLDIENNIDDDCDESDDDDRVVFESEEVSMISVNSSASRNLRRAEKLRQLQQIQHNSNHNPSSDFDSQKNGSQITHHDVEDDEDDKRIRTCEYDDKGRCVRHPKYQLRKKKMLKGWVTILENCPECCLDEMKRVKQKYKEQVVRTSSSGGSRGGDGSSSHISTHSNSVSNNSAYKKKEKKKKEKDKSSHPPPIRQLNVKTCRGSGVDDNDSSNGTESTFTITSSFTNTSGKWQNYLSSNASSSSGGGGASAQALPTTTTTATTTSARVTRLPYNDQYGENGWYTGEVDPVRGIPSGWGVLNYANGQVYEGEWRNGVSLAPTKTREAPNMLEGRGGGGGGSSYSPHHHHHHYKSSSRHGVQSSLNEQRRGDSVPPTTGRQSSTSRGGSVPPVPVSRRHSHATRLEPLHEDPVVVPVSSPFSHHGFVPSSRVVSSMSYRDKRGFVIGTYTGEVDVNNIPNGIGSMRYSGGFISEGRWVDGELNDGYNVTDYGGGGGGHDDSW